VIEGETTKQLMIVTLYAIVVSKYHVFDFKNVKTHPRSAPHTNETGRPPRCLLRVLSTCEVSENPDVHATMKDELEILMNCIAISGILVS
jgi:hypothetical protein